MSKTMALIVVLAMVLQSCAGLTKPIQFTDFNCPHPYSEVIKAEAYVADLVSVPRDLLPPSRLAQTHFMYQPSDAPDIDPGFFPFAVIEIVGTASGPEFEAIKHHELCHIYETLSAYDRTADPELIMEMHMKTFNHVGWRQGPSVWWKAAKAKEKRIYARSN